jgi:predicted enzyme related to lactoylglutathione lyase
VLGSAELVAFVPSTDLTRSAHFYGEALGLDVGEIDPYACVVRSGATALRITLVESFTPHPFTVLGWSVPDIADSVRVLAGRGVQTVRYEWMDQDQLGIWTAPSGDQIAWFVDPDGNTLSLSQRAG